MRKGLLALLGTGLAAFAVTADETVRLDRRGAVRLADSGVVLEPIVIRPGWHCLTGSDLQDFAQVPEAGRPFAFAFKAGKELVAKGHVTAVASGGAATFAWRYDLPAGADWLSLGATARLPVDRFAGATVTAAGMSATLPAAFGEMTLLSVSRAGAFTLRLPDGKAWTVRFPEPTDVLVQDGRKWGPTYAVRFGRLAESTSDGAPFTWSYAVTADAPVALTLSTPVTIRPDDRWIPVDYEKDIAPGSALDFSVFGFLDAPAGKHGWLRNVGGHFEFERLPGKPQRFYGVNFVGSMNFPAPEDADRIVERLARLGYNTVRFHHHDEGCVQGAKDRVTLNLGMMDRFDSFFAKLVARGFYVTTDLYVSRRLTRGDLGVDGDPDEVVNAGIAKGLFALHEPAYRLWEGFARNFLTHVNPYTGRAYKDEPALNLISLVNENEMGMRWTDLRNERTFREAWTAWIGKMRAEQPGLVPDALAETPPESLNWWGENSELVDRFAAEKEAALFLRMRTFLRGLGVKALFTNQNNGRHAAAHQMVAAKLYDYVDDHFYVDHPHFLQTPWQLPSQCGNENPIFDPRLPTCRVAFARLYGRPFVLTEYNYSGPGRFRGVGGILTGAMGALQDWDGLWRFAYAHDVRKVADDWGAPHYFDIATDPLSQASDRASLLLFLRRDLEPLTDALTLAVTPGAVRETPGRRTVSAAPKWMNEAWRVRVGARPARECDGQPDVYDIVRFGGTWASAPTNCPKALAAPTGIVLDRARGSFTVDTPRTQGGFAERGEIRTPAFRALVDGCAATVWASSLDGRPLTESRRILVTHLTDVQGDGTTYAEEDRKVLLKWGRNKGMGIALCESGTAEIALRTGLKPQAVAVYELATSGRRVRPVPCTVRDGALRFTATVRNPDGRARLCYEVVAEVAAAPVPPPAE